MFVSSHSPRNPVALYTYPLPPFPGAGSPTIRPFLSAVEALEVRQMSVSWLKTENTLVAACVCCRFLSKTDAFFGTKNASMRSCGAPFACYSRAQPTVRTHYLLAINGKLRFMQGWCRPWHRRRVRLRGLQQRRRGAYAPHALTLVRRTSSASPLMGVGGATTASDTLPSPASHTLISRPHSELRICFPVILRSGLGSKME